MNTPRRKFLKFVTFGTAISVIGGKLWQREVLAYCAPYPGSKDAVFKVRVSDYPALQQDWGSVRLGINPVRPDAEPFPDGDFWPFLINRDNTGKFYVLDCECGHASCVVPTFDESVMSIECPCHGSRYAINGAILNGPTTQPLHSYQFEFDGNDTLTIHIPCWGFETKAVVLPGGPLSRIRLDFTAFNGVTYEVNFRQHHSDPWTRSSFATTPGGQANETSLTTFGGDVSVYLNRSTPTGFYALSARLSEV